MLLGLFPRLISTDWYRCWTERRYSARSVVYDEKVIAAEGSRYGRGLEAGIDFLRQRELRPKQILDVGTGTGFVILRLAREYPAAELVACDISTAMLQRARLNTRHAQTRVTWVRAQVGTLPFADGSFDLVALQNGPANVAELLRVVKPGGWLLLAYTSGGLVPKLGQHLQRALQRHSDAVERIGCGDGLCLLARKLA